MDAIIRLMFGFFCFTTVMASGVKMVVEAIKTEGLKSCISQHTLNCESGLLDQKMKDGIDLTDVVNLSDFMDSVRHPQECFRWPSELVDECAQKYEVQLD